MPEPDINTSSYDKAARYKLGHGYQLRVKPVTSVVVHSTSNSIKNTSLASEAKFLFESPLVSAHYLIGKSGEVIRFLDPRAFVAWHAGNCLAAFSNAKSCGIELHHSVGDPPYPPAQLDALAALLRSLMALFNILVAQIETHGQVALPGPYDRKRDPSDWSYSSFLAFRSCLDTPTPPAPTRYAVIGLPIYERSDRTGPLWGHMNAGEVVTIDDPKTGHDALGRGFVDMKGLEPL